MIQHAVQRVSESVDLTREESFEVMGEIADGRATAAQVGALLLGLRLKGETAEEITGAAMMMRARLERVRVDAGVFVDTCGTGGDGSNTFNISTTAAFVVAAAGVTVAKHGNRSVSSRCGSADVLEALGVAVDGGRSVAEDCISKVGIGFLFAPHHHPAFKAVGAIRRELGVRTIFNLLGPLANPALARHQVLGVYHPKWVPVVAEVLVSLGSLRAFVVHGQGLDEISLGGTTSVAEVRNGRVVSYEVSPEELGLPRCDVSALLGGDAAHNARMVRDVLGGQKGPPRDMVLANAAAALVAADAAEDFRHGIRLAASAIDAGQALAKLQALVEQTR